MKKLAFLLIIFTLCMLFSAAFASEPCITAVNLFGEEIPVSVEWWYSSQQRTWYLFLPSGTADTITLQLDGFSSPEVNGETAGDTFTLSITNEAPILVKDGSKTYSVIPLRSQNLCSLFLSTASGNMTRLEENKHNTEPGYLRAFSENGSALFSGRIEKMHGHGNSTFRLYKKSWKIRLSDEYALAGSKAQKSWLLLANHFDNSLIRTAITFEMARYAGMKNISAYRFCDLYLNGQYAGNYMIASPVSVDMADLSAATAEANHGSVESAAQTGTYSAENETWKGYRIESPEDISGGYLFELELSNRYEEWETNGFVTRTGQSVVIRQPAKACKDEITYLAGVYGELESALHEDSGIAPATGRHYSQIADMESLILKMMVQEITKNHDGNKSSQYLYKSSNEDGGLIHAGPVWDYDRSYGNFYLGTQRAGTGRHWMTVNASKALFYPNLYKHADVLDAVKGYYPRLFRPYLQMLLGLQEIEGFRSLADWEAYMTPSARMNFLRYPVFNTATRKIKTGADYPANITFLRTWITQRVEWLDQYWQ